MKNNILVIAPHADDEVLGCGATIRKKVNAGAEVYVLIMTNAFLGAPELFSQELIKKVRLEALRAHALLGVKETIFLNFPAPVLDQYPSYKLSLAITDVIKAKLIDTVYIPHHGDVHKDHQMIHDAALVACRPTGDSPVREIYAYETLSETEWGRPESANVFIPTLFEVIDDDVFEKKLLSMKCFESQLQEFPASRSLETIEALAKYRGATVNRRRAEAFMSIRKINN